MYFTLDHDYPMDDDDGYYMAEDGIDFDGVDSWALGRRFTRPPPDPIQIALVPVKDFTGEPSPMFDGYMCLMNEAMVTALRGCGVDNLDVYRAVLTDHVNAREFRYFAVNILELVAAADLRKSQFSSFDGDVRLDTHFDSLVLDPAKAGARLMFRLAEDTGTIVVHEKVKQALADIPQLRFLPL